VSLIAGGVSEVVPAPRPGRRFEPVAERELAADLRPLAARLPGASDGLLLIAEMPGPRGVADMVAITHASPGIEERIDAGIPFLENLADCSVVASAMVHRTLSVATISKIAGMSEQQAERRLRSLSRSGHVERVGAGYRRHEQMIPIGRAYAIEAKVSDWQQGIRQALSYSSWCDAASLVLRDGPRDLDEVMNRCRSFGIGLALQSRWLVRPRIGKPRASWRLSVSERMARAVATGVSLRED